MSLFDCFNAGSGARLKYFELISNLNGIILSIIRMIIKTKKAIRIFTDFYFVFLTGVKISKYPKS
jgi:hypothetical protein